VTNCTGHSHHDQYFTIELECLSTIHSVWHNTTDALTAELDFADKMIYAGRPVIRRRDHEPYDWIRQIDPSSLFAMPPPRSDESIIARYQYARELLIDIMHMVRDSTIDDAYRRITAEMPLGLYKPDYILSVMTAQSAVARGRIIAQLGLIAARWDELVRRLCIAGVRCNTTKLAAVSEHLGAYLNI
jgi:hypothetical protein